MSVEQNSFITNRDRFLSEVINGILPKCSSVDILVGYFYYSGFDLICENFKDKNIHIYVGLEVDVQVPNKINEVDIFLKTNQSIGQIKEDYYAFLVKLFNDTNCFDSDSKVGAFKLFYSKILNGTLEI